MKAKLLCDAGEIREGTDVDVVSKTIGTDDARAANDPDGARAQPAPVYRVTDDDGHAEDVDTRDLKIVR
jgi:hypothetical protein